ncbi:hypothetical protein SK571_18420 [Lentzea sp. BCCO 10_0798]|uniref:Proteins of 100 residues with WXG n=1 Tax=Lentzea kristufekii TaxID=3095430 RepID=A0ABU4TSU7_9PSEU|nr:hypothetical protein [Lentzea sp. BCCO 10_0798]MDX8051368.1 hypothetical protein [Lentzea sp. BCCO 10_0798]
MAEEEFEAGGVKITVGEKTTGQKMAEAAPFYGSYLKTKEAFGKSGETGGSAALASEGSALISAVGTAAQGIAMDPIGWLVGQGLNFLISVVQPLEDAIHFVSGDGPALSQAGENYGAIAEGIGKLRETFDQDLSSSVQTWGGQTAEVASTRLGEFANGIDGVAGQAGELAEMLMISSMIMTIIEDIIKAILTELITWLIMIWIPALAAAVPSFGASTAAAGAATGVRVASTASRVSRIVAKLRQFLQKIMEFLRKLGSRLKNVRTAFQKSMADKKVASHAADVQLQGLSKLQKLKANPLTRLNSKDGMIGERVQQGFGKSMVDAAGNEALAQVNPTHEKGLRNQGMTDKANSYDETGSDHSKQRIEGYLDI